MANYTAPPLIKSDVSHCGLKLMGTSISSFNASQSCGLFLSPVFAYKAGNLYGEEFALLKSLSNCGCLVDASFQLIFGVKSKTVPGTKMVQPILAFFVGDPN